MYAICPLRPSWTRRRNAAFFYADCLILLINMSWQSLLIDQLGLNVFTYKCCLALGWIPFFLSMLFIFPTAKAAQIFILGMQGIYMFALHGLSGSAPYSFSPIYQRKTS